MQGGENLARTYVVVHLLLVSLELAKYDLVLVYTILVDPWQLILAILSLLLHNGSTTAITTVAVFIHHFLNLVQKLAFVWTRKDSTNELILCGLTRLDCFYVLLVAQRDSFGRGISCSSFGVNINNRLSECASRDQIAAAVPDRII